MVQETDVQLSKAATILLPEEPFRKKLGVEPATFAATEEEKVSYQQILAKRQGKAKYFFADILDAGGMGAVCRVQDQDLHRPVAMKILLPERKRDGKALTDFVKEAKINGFLEHPNIAPLHEFGLFPEIGMFFTMKLIQGEALSDILVEMKRGKPYYLETYHTYALLNIFRKVCDAVAYAHSVGIIHQDIKPDNIIVGRYGEVFLIDWGAAHIIRKPEAEADPVKRQFLAEMSAEAALRSEQDKRIQGSLSFLSPEQSFGRRDLLDERSDIFLLGATLYAMFTLELPYIGATLPEILNKARRRDLIPPEVRSPDRQIPEAICRVIMKMMAADKADRYPSVEALAQEIDQLIAGKWLPHELKVFETGEILIHEGGVGEEAYLILRGNVLVTKEAAGTRVVLGACQEGDIIGEMSLISDEPRSATVQALEPTTVAVLTKDVLAQHLEKLPPYMGKIVSALTNRLQHTETLLHPHLTTDCTAIVLKYLRLLFHEHAALSGVSAPLLYEEAVEEISCDLGIPQPKVRNVLETAIYLKLLSKEQNLIRIPNPEALTRYTE